MCLSAGRPWSCFLPQQDIFYRSMNYPSILQLTEDILKKKKKVEIIHLSIANIKEKSKHIERKNTSLQFPVDNQHYTKHKL